MLISLDVVCLEETGPSVNNPDHRCIFIAAAFIDKGAGVSYLVLTESMWALASVCDLRAGRYCDYG